MARLGQRQRRVVATVVTFATVAVATMATVLPAHAAPGRGAQASAPKWKVGDCFATVDADESAVDLSSKVSCTKDHAAQIVGGAELPASLASNTHDELFASEASVAELDEFAVEACAATETVGNVYPAKTAKALTRLFGQYGVDEWIPPAAGALTIFLPDEASFDAGATDVLCVFLPDESFSGSTAGDVRRIGSGDLLESLRICYLRNPGSGTELTPCDEDHDLESLIFLKQDVTGLPVDPNQWSGDDWAGFDDMCAEFGPVMVGAARKDLTFRANTQQDNPPVGGFRFVYCEALPAAEGKALPGGTTVSGIGKKKIAFAKA